MIFGTFRSLTRFDNVVVSYENNEISRADNFKYLVVILDPTLTFECHVDYIHRKWWKG